MNGFLDSPEFQAELNAVCRSVFSHHGHIQTKYANSEELAQEVSLRIIQKDWYSHFRGDAKWSTACWRIAYNLIIDESRRDMAAKRRRDLAVSLDQPGWDRLSGSSGKEIENQILLDECLAQLTAEERRIYVESRRGRTLQSIGGELGYSATTAGNKLKAIILKLEECLNS